MLIMETLKRVAPQLRPRLPAAREALRRRQRLGQAQQLVDGHRHRRATCSNPGDTPHDNMQFLFFCAAVIRAVDKHQALLRASIAVGRPTTTAWAPTRPRRRSSRSSWAELLQDIFEQIETGERQAHQAGRDPGPRRPGAAAAAQARRRPQPHQPVRLHRQQVRVPRARLRRSRCRCPNTVLNTIVAEALDYARRASWRTRSRAASSLEAGGAADRQGASRTATSRSSSTATTTRRSGTRRPRGAAWRTCARRSTRCRGWSRTDGRACSPTTTCSPSASCTRATTCSSSSTSIKVNIEAETAADIARDDAAARRRSATSSC